ncbi:bifunctional 4-hydroxy-2-oxoglutarate aldolase/2-dehydro-3-deoxy-phosphogluconate aldolase [Dolosicoccus paucivorans]|uniref:bifunctional 4-hydroxy-2-oxoglutarate aldolase/2-dehydro-3-deoxy-phosphogluconate aldolase n=1 Tax=Dolosicoccus paucivorans TaxID=84521 RepID=UPI00088D6860|nr:bifunctional 4-hydroxy-2-oxoglutarate aldolase/2-dehydro-3-deoxy-phosphogluconate aldolase [Dolosicoccus paucivorans]PMB85071.1 4-hydroxy-2-oxoglutarate aldolase [Dolosicoccus paucivorans]SDI68156.1 2-dehydro-3-deoxyphosphogluconate aldolase / (4S)-4-hydroxy-2-oxoglutarate aldolase [Dolosicoccus paucivorans]
MSVIEEIKRVKLLPLYTATDLSLLPIVEDILVKYDVPIIEVTYRSELASEAIKILSESGKLIVGAGTVRTIEQAIEAVKNGAEFIVSPAFSEEVVDYCIENNIPVFPGTVTPGDIQKATEKGIYNVKFFPANIYGGLDAIKALSGPFYDVSFLPTGGINSGNISEYLANNAIIAVGGSFIISEKEVAKDKGKTASKNLENLLSIIR